MKFLHIDPSQEDLELAETLISRTSSWRYYSATSLREGLALWRAMPYQFVLLGIRGQNSNEFFDAIKEMSQDSIVFALSDDTSQEIVNKCRDAGAVGFINKTALANPQAFDDAIHAGIDAHVRKVESGDLGPVLATISQLGKAVLWGNGEPPLMSRMSVVETKLTGVAEGVHELKEIGESRRVEVNDRFDKLDRNYLYTFLVVLAGYLLQAYAIAHHVDPAHLLPLPGMDAAAQQTGH